MTLLSPLTRQIRRLIFESRPITHPCFVLLRIAARDCALDNDTAIRD